MLLAWLSKVTRFMWASSVSLYLCNFWTWKPFWANFNTGVRISEAIKFLQWNQVVKEKSLHDRAWHIGSAFIRYQRIFVSSEVSQLWESKIYNRPVDTVTLENALYWFWWCSEILFYFQKMLKLQLLHLRWFFQIYLGRYILIQQLTSCFPHTYRSS